mmetsp:Transcript_5812/g.9165  ORF Transcript_5812/g.9165 Transcript_5812/m.9165 type:complete len:520 (-) Transcript_5812:58-1617(-)
MQDPYHDNDEASTLGSKSFDGEGEDSISNGSHAQGFTPSNTHALPRIVTASDELESLCRAEMSGGNDARIVGFPPTCLPIVRLLAGNHCCVDCGDEDQDRLRYASIGYGTLLCQECAHRHAVMSEGESNIKSLEEDPWNLRSTLALLEGSNTKMLDYVKHKPRWRPPKGNKSSEVLSEDALAFKQIYLSKGAGAYRKDLGRKVDDIFYSRITAMREHDAAKEELLQIMALTVSPRDPFRQIFEQNDVSPEDIPGFFANIASRGGGGVTDGSGSNVGAISSAIKARGSVGRKGRNMSTPLMKHESPSMNLIKERINSRRSMNSSILMDQHVLPAAEDDDQWGDLHANDVNVNAHSVAPFSSEEPESTGKSNSKNIADGYLPQSSRQSLPQQSSRRQSSDYGMGLVGEVGDTSIQGQHDDQTSIGGGSYPRLPMEQKWSNHDHGEDQTMASYSSRAEAPPAPLGTYRRLSSAGGRGRLVAQRPLDTGSGRGQFVSQRQLSSGSDIGGRAVSRRPMYHPPKS